MTFICSEDHKAPFFIPFVVAVLFGVPASVIWYLVAVQTGWLYGAITILLGCSCGLGARIAAKGEHPASGAVVATFILIVLNIAVLTVLSLAWRAGETFMVILVAVIDHGDYNDLANEIVRSAGRTFIGYPFALYAAYRVSDGT